MKVFAPTSSCADSAYLLYKLLSETTDDVIARILRLDANDHELAQYPIVCNWLKENVRDFDFDFAEFEEPAWEEKAPIIISKEFNIALLSEMHNVDLISSGHNTYNWSHSTWYFQTTKPIIIDNFFKKDNPYSRIDHSILRDYTDIPVDWPFMDRKDGPIGRWETWELLPDELRKLVAHCSCGKCPKCKCWSWYTKKKDEGLSADEIDDTIMKEGKYGKYYTKGSTKKTRHDAYLTDNF